MREKRWCFLSLFIILVDQGIKALIRYFLTYREILSVFPPFFSLTYVENKGGAFSLFHQFPWLLSSFSLITICVLVVLFWKRKASLLTQVAWSFLLGGAIGNLLDRLFLGAVTDYLSFTFGKYSYPVFNFADICVVLGVILFLFLEGRKQNGIHCA